METKKARGLAIKELKRFVVDNYGEEGFKKLLEVLSPEAQNIINHPIMDAATYPIDILLEVNRKICEVFGNGDPEFARKMGNYGASMSLKGPFKIIFKLADIKWVIKRGPMIYSHYFPEMGRLEVIEINEETNTATIAIKDPPFKDIYYERAIAGWMEKVGRSFGEKNFKVEIIKSPTHGSRNIEFLVSW